MRRPTSTSSASSPTRTSASSRSPTATPAADAARALAEEGADVLRAIPASSYVVALDVGGRQLSSEGFSADIDDLALHGSSHLVFVIGGSVGLSADVLGACGCAAVARADDAASQPRARRAARAALSRVPNQPRRALPQVGCFARVFPHRVSLQVTPRPDPRRPRITVKDAISQLVTAALAELRSKRASCRSPRLPDPALERPRDAAHGDWATSVALRSAKAAGMNPRAGRRDHLGEASRAIRTSTPSRSRAPASSTSGCRRQRSSACFARRGTAASTSAAATRAPARRVQVEFVSANPVGPMHVGHGRWAALGDSMARVLEHAGWSVEREFYINDAGVQMDIFAKSVAARYLELCGGRSRSSRSGTRAPTSPRSPARSSSAEGDVLGRRARRRSARRTSRRRRTSRCSSTSSTCCTGWASTSTSGSRSARCTSRSPAARPRSSAASTALREAGYIYELDGATVVPLDRLRRRQGPRAGQGRRRLHVLRRRHRLPQEQVRPRLRPRHQHLGRRPPRLRRRA